MTNIIEINCETNERIERPATEKEVARLNELQNAFELEKANGLEKAAKRQALLEKLGISEEEAKLLRG